MRKIVAGLAAGLFLTACQDHETIGPRKTDEHLRAEIPQDVSPENAVAWVFNCQNGQRLMIDFDHPRQMATVRRLDGLAFDLTRKLTAEGYLYEASGLVLSGKGKTANWHAPNADDTVCEVSEIKPLV